MSKIHFAAAIVAAPFLSLASASAQAPRPNIILAMADDMGWGDPSCYSSGVTFANGSAHPDQGWISTPTIDAMAQKKIMGAKCECDEIIDNIEDIDSAVSVVDEKIDNLKVRLKTIEEEGIDA